MKTKKKGHGFMMILTIIFTLSTISTLIPQPSASKACLLGYHAHCTFTPISTVLSLLLAALFCVIRKKRFTQEEAEKS